VRVVRTIDVPSGALAFTVPPAYRGRGYCQQILHAVFDAPEVADIAVFGAGVEPENRASSACLRAAGFSQENEEPDFEGMVYFVRRR
jgi:RimJ/RimL family protein N-acetyltransferase